MNCRSTTPRATSAAARPRRHLLLGLAAVLTVLGQCASASTYYVSTSGNDSNAGTQSAPFRHLSKGAAAATQPGDTVIVMDGTYDNEGQVAPNYVVTLYYSGTSGNPITFQAQHRGMAILDSMNTSTTTACNGAYSYFNLYNASFIVIQGFVIQRGCNEGIHSNDNAHDIVIKQNVIQYIGNHTNTTQIGMDGIYLNNSEYNFTFDSNTFHDIGRTSGQTQLHFDHGIYTHAATVTIINNTFYNMNAGWSIQLADGASNMLIANNTFAFPNTGDGESGQIMWWGGNTNVTVRNNIFYNPNTSAMTQYAATISGCVFDHNLVYPASSVMDSSFPCSVTSNVLGSGNPQFVNASTSSPNFNTQSSGAGVDAGVTLSQVPNDCMGTTRPQGSSTDMGAYEYISSSGGTAPIISGVFTSSITSNSAVVNWTTDQNANSYANYGTNSNYGSTSSVNSNMVTIHSVALSNLSASTTYHFQVGSANSSGQTTLSSDSAFTTPAGSPPPAPTFSFSLSAGSVSLKQGASASSSVTASLVSGTAAPVAFNASGLPSGATASFSSSCSPTCTTTLTIAASMSTPVGTYTIGVAGSGSGASASTAITLTVTKHHH
jgi:parallel beta helix pectate lyase-like protein/purple acid phosphatase-like protein